VAISVPPNPPPLKKGFSGKHRGFQKGAEIVQKLFRPDAIQFPRIIGTTAMQNNRATTPFQPRNARRRKQTKLSVYARGFTIYDFPAC
jgi:hypothetical protein